MSIQCVNTGSVSEDQPALLFSRTLAALGFSKSDAGRETMRHGHEAQSRAPMVFLTPSSIKLAGLGGIQCTRVSQPGIAYETDHRFTHIYHTCYMVSMHPGDRIPHKNQARASPSSGTPLLHQQSSSHDPRKCLSSAPTSALQP